MGIGQFYLTDKGANLLAKAQIGGEISYTKAKIGDGFVPDGTAITSLTDLVKPLKNLNLIELSISQKQAIVEIEFTNQGLAPFWWMEIGLFATDPDEGEILYAYGNAGTQEKADYINGVLTEFKFNMIMPIQNATNVTAVINESLVYPSKEELTGHINNKNNPHGITKVELGLENVQNTADIDKVMSNPTRTYVGDKATLTTTAKTNLVQAINEVNQSASGASGAVNAHVANKSNPHVVTKAQLGLENVANAEQATKTEFNAHNADMVKHITAGERTAWNGKADNSSVTTALNSKVDKIDGMGLSSNDYTTAEKSKLAGIQENATDYTHPPTHPTAMIEGLDATLEQTATKEDVNVINRIADIFETLNTKVDKVTGKELSTNDYTDNDKKKLTNIINHFTGTATHSNDVLAIFTDTQNYNSFLVTFTAPTNYCVTDTYTINGVPFTLRDLRNRSLLHGWIEATPVTFQFQGDKAFFKVGGEFSTGDLLPRKRVQQIYDETIPFKANGISTHICHHANNFLVCSSYDNDRTHYLYSIKYGSLNLLKSGAQSMMKPYDNLYSSFIDDYFVECTTTGKLSKREVRKDNVILKEKQLEYTTPTYVYATETHFYVFFRVVNKLMKFDIELNLIWSVDYTMEKQHQEEIRQGPYRLPCKVCKNKIHIYNNKEKRYNILSDDNGNFISNSIEFKSPLDINDSCKTAIDDDGFMYVNKFSSSIGNWIQKYAQDCNTLIVEIKIDSGTTCLAGLLCTSHLWVSETLNKTIKAYSLDNLSLISQIPSIPWGSTYTEYLTYGSKYNETIVTYWSTGYDAGRVLSNSNIKEYLITEGEQ